MCLVLSSSNLLVQCFTDGIASYTDMPVPKEVLAGFRDRKDGQIMGLEILSIALGKAGAGSLLFWVYSACARRVDVQQRHQWQKSCNMVR